MRQIDNNGIVLINIRPWHIVGSIIWQQLGTIVEGRVQQVVGQVVQRGHSGSEDYDRLNTLTVSH